MFGFVKSLEDSLLPSLKVALNVALNPKWDVANLDAKVLAGWIVLVEFAFGECPSPSMPLLVSKFFVNVAS